VPADPPARRRGAVEFDRVRPPRASSTAGRGHEQGGGHPAVTRPRPALADIASVSAGKAPEDGFDRGNSGRKGIPTRSTLSGGGARAISDGSHGRTARPRFARRRAAHHEVGSPPAMPAAVAEISALGPRERRSDRRTVIIATRPPASTRRSAEPATGGMGGGYDLVMALVVELSEDELFVRAIHRLIAGLPPRGRTWWMPCAAISLSKAVLGGPSCAAEAMSAKGGLGLVTADGHPACSSRCRQSTRPRRPTSTRAASTSRWRICRHTSSPNQHGAEQRQPSWPSGQAQAAVLVAPATVAQIADPLTAAGACRRRPVFHPKPRTGMVFRTVEAERPARRQLGSGRDAAGRAPPRRPA